MYVEDFNTFYQQAEELLLKDPIKTRYVVKYRHTDGKLVLKVTDDDVVRQRLVVRLRYSCH
jgi:signal recognition particle subunit SRP9